MYDCVSTVQSTVNEPLEDRTISLLLTCKLCGAIFCLAGTLTLIILPSTFLSCCATSILFPTFIPGYLIINIVGFLSNYVRQEFHLIADILFSTLGVCLNLFFVVYIMLDWSELYIKIMRTDYAHHYGFQYFVLAVLALLNFIVSLTQLIFCIREVYINATLEEEI
ncbi:uncharacterized protein LOC130663560 [Microplitis mediator]|uniref:uncharacterized protein LOC130663560 n=1 Tax=Microplitis mediator TaxID=375433 RepID=UPI002557C004|nr:uncharacterized protein LOC130663560 [Microplitis mediator]XP_057318826.1 uncharacterized protein LOC130663560 [Microplitis mediator]